MVGADQSFSAKSLDTPETSPQQSADNATLTAADYEARLEEMANLVMRVRHEINNPLTGVLGQAQLLLREDLSESVRKRAVTIEELAIRMRDIVAQLRQVQKSLKP